MGMRIGQGYDIHQLMPDRDLILGGVKIQYHLGLFGHSDADVLLHAIIDALLGAACLGDIGRHFPDTDMTYAGVFSLDLLKVTRDRVATSSFRVVNVDATVIAQAPKLAGYIDAMRTNIAAALSVSVDRVNVKAKTNESLDAIGQHKAISAQAIVLMEKVEKKSA